MGNEFRRRLRERRKCYCSPSRSRHGASNLMSQRRFAATWRTNNQRQRPARHAPSHEDIQARHTEMFGTPHLALGRFNVGFTGRVENIERTDAIVMVFLATTFKPGGLTLLRLVAHQISGAEPHAFRHLQARGGSAVSFRATSIAVSACLWQNRELSRGVTASDASQRW